MRWLLGDIGFNSKAGTLVYEFSHFILHGETDDYAQGNRDVRALALSDPDLAVVNADSH